MQTFDFENSADFQSYLRRIDMGAVTGADLERVKRKWFDKTFPEQASAYTGPRPTAPPPSPPQSRSGGGGAPGAARPRAAPAAGGRIGA